MSESISFIFSCRIRRRFFAATAARWILALRSCRFSAAGVMIKWSTSRKRTGIVVVTKTTEKMAPRPTRRPTSLMAGIEDPDKTLGQIREEL